MLSVKCCSLIIIHCCVITPVITTAIIYNLPIVYKHLVNIIGKGGISDWNVPTDADAIAAATVQTSAVIVYTLYDSSWSQEQHGLHSCIRTSKVIEWYITIGSHWSVLGLNSSGNSWNGLRISSRYLDLACGYSYCRHWLCLVWLNTLSLKKAWIWLIKQV